MDDPSTLSGQELSVLEEAVAQNKATEILLYTRGSDRLIQGRIWYELDGVTNYVPFVTTEDFERNQSVTIYAYFTQNGIQFTAQCDPWSTNIVNTDLTGSE